MSIFIRVVNHFSDILVRNFYDNISTSKLMKSNCENQDIFAIQQ